MYYQCFDYSLAKLFFKAFQIYFQTYFQTYFQEQLNVFIITINIISIFKYVLRQSADSRRRVSWLPPDKQYLVTYGVSCRSRVRDLDVSISKSVIKSISKKRFVELYQSVISLYDEGILRFIYLPSIFQHIHLYISIIIIV